MYFELQMSGAVFARAVRNRLRSIPLAVDLSFLIRTTPPIRWWWTR